MGLIANFKWLWDRRKKFPPDDIHRAGELAEMRLVKLSRAAGRIVVGKSMILSEYQTPMVEEEKLIWF